VRSLAVRAGRVVGVRTEEGLVEADAVVLAAGAWTSALAQEVGLHRPLIPVRRTLLQTAPHPASRLDHPWTWVDDAGLYVRAEAGGFLVSGCDEAVDWPLAGPGSRGPVEPEHRALAVAKLERYLPALADARVVGGWTGLRTFAPDRRPVLGADGDLDGLWWAAGLGGFGVTCSYAVGEAVAAWFLGREVPWLHRDSVSPARDMPRRWPVRPDGDLGHARLVGVVEPDR
jgi:D-arginine dehydrogenase